MQGVPQPKNPHLHPDRRGNYKIAGEWEFFAGVLLSSSIFLLLALFAAKVAVVAGLGLLPFLVAAAALHVAAIEAWLASVSDEGFNKPCFLSGLLFGLTAAALFIKPEVGAVLWIGPNLIPGGLPIAIDCVT
jgi:hypothetical protein